jgi:16S rRNA processing protein RimM
VTDTKTKNSFEVPSASESNKLLLGKFGAAQGLKGEIRLQSYTANPFAIGSYGALTANDGRKFEITHLRAGKANAEKNILIARIKKITDRTGAEQLTNLTLYIDRALLGEIQEEDEYFHADLVGLNVETDDGVQLGKVLIGKVLALFNFGAGDMLEIKPIEGGKSVMLPFTKAAVPEIDLRNKRMIVDFASFESAKDDKPDPLDQIN